MGLSNSGYIFFNAEGNMNVSNFLGQTLFWDDASGLEVSSWKSLPPIPQQ